MARIRLTSGLRTPALALVMLVLCIYYLPTASRIYHNSAVKGLRLRKPTYQGRRDPPVLGCPADDFSSPVKHLTRLDTKEKACVLLLAREDDLSSLVDTLGNFEDTFNAKFRYPYVFLKEDNMYSATFQHRIRQVLPASAVAEFGVIPKEHWSIPDWLNPEEIRRGFAAMGQQGIQYADRESYHHMCRYYSGLFALHPLLQKYNYYWRLEPGVRFYCQLQYDPFRYMAQHDKVYGWVITIVETPNTIPTLFDSVLDWRTQTEHNNTMSGQFGAKVPLAPWNSKDDLWDFFLENKDRHWTGRLLQQEKYNLCHFWTNFEIGDLRFFRSLEYQSLFDFLDRKGGFYTERWGDAPIRSLALGLLAGFDRVHYFEDIAYKHDWFMHKPTAAKVGCKCVAPNFDDSARDIDNDGWYSCLPRWRALDVA